jgi:hypothetical protein
MRLDAKVPGALKGNYVVAVVVSIVALGACGRRAQGPEPRLTPLPEAVRPAFLAEAARKLGGAHYHATLRYAVGRAGATPLAVTTTTDVWLDRAGNYRLRDENDRDGGREVVLTGRELAVALRYGKMIRRVAEEPEPSQLLAEGLGAPAAAFELCAPQAHIEKSRAEHEVGPAYTAYELSLGEATKSAAPALPLVGLRAWRGNVALDKLTGRAVVDDATGALVAFELTAAWGVKGPNGEGAAEQGTVEVHAALTEVGATAAIERPAADELVLRQRTVPEARELLRGLAEERRNGATTRQERRP